MDQNRLLGDDEYDDGQIYQLVPGSLLDSAIRREPWLNMTDASRRRWIRLMNNPNTVFVGTVLSEPRRQIELTIIYQHNDRRWCVNVMVTLHDFDRFIGPPPA